MRVAHVPMPLSTGASSVTTVARQLARQEQARGGTVFAIMSSERDVDFDDAHIVSVEYARYCPRQWFTEKEMLVDHALGLIGLRRRFSGKIFVPAIEAARTLEVDVVFLHEGHYATGSLAYWRKLWPDARVVLYVHTPISRAYRRRELTRRLNQAAHVIFVSEQLRVATLSRAGRLNVSTAVVHNGIDQQIFHARGRTPRTRALRVTFAGQVAEHKGVHLILAAANQAVGDLTIQIVGRPQHGDTGPLSDYETGLRNTPMRPGVTVHFAPYLPHGKLADAFRDSDVVCVPSIWEEPFGMVVLEAMGCGAAVIASARGGLPEACGGAAQIVDPLDGAAFAEALNWLQQPQNLDAAQAGSVARAAGASWAAAYDVVLDGIGRSD